MHFQRKMKNHIITESSITFNIYDLLQRNHLDVTTSIDNTQYGSISIDPRVIQIRLKNRVTLKFVKFSELLSYE